MKRVRRFILKIYRKSVFLYAWLTRVVLQKSWFQVPLHIRIWMNLNGYLADQYVLFDLKHNSMNDYLSELDWYKSRFVNDKYRLLLNNKLVCNDLLQEKISVPSVYVIKDGMLITDSKGHKISMDDVLHIVQKQKHVFIKPIAAGKGKSVFSADYLNERWFINDAESDKSEFCSRLSSMKNFYISERIFQASFLNEIYDKSVNTMRIVTIRDPETNQCCISNAVQRFGISECVPVDNASQGGLTAKIDLKTGALSSAKSLRMLGAFTVHPDSGAQIEGIVIPEWESICNRIIDIAESFPYLKLIAWDLLITDEGISVIEANASSGINILQLWDGQRQKELGKFLKYHGVIK